MIAPDGPYVRELKTQKQMNKQLRPSRPSLLLANRDPGDSDEEAYEKACQALESAPVKEFSGFRLHQRDPRKYALICRMLGENLSTSMIARACGVSPHTIEAVREREKISIDLERSRLLDRVRAASRLCVERLTELIPTMSARDAAIASGIFIEKGLLLAGEPTEIYLNKGEQPSHDDFNALLAQLPSADARIIPADSAGEVEDKPGEAVAESNESNWPSPKTKRPVQLGGRNGLRK